MSAGPPPGWGDILDGKRFCHPDGPSPCPIMLVGEGPGKHEAAQGECFVGPAGETLDRFLWKLGLERGADVYTTNLVKYRVADAKDDKPPKETHIARDWPYLRWEIETVQPRFLLSIGGAATRALTTPPHPMDALNGRPITAPEFSRRLLSCTHLPEFVIPSIHPAAGLRDPDLGGRCWQGLKLAADFIKTGTHPFLFNYPRLEPAATGRYTRLRTTAEVLEWLYTDVTSWLAIDTEGSIRRPWMLSVSVGGNRGIVIYAEDIEALEALNWYINEYDILVILHSALHDLPVLRAMGVVFKRYADTMVLAFLSNMEPQGLKGLSWRVNGIEMSSYADVVEPASLARALDYLRATMERLKEDDLGIKPATKRGHGPVRRIRDALNRISKKLSVDEDEDEEEGEEEEAAESLAPDDEQDSLDKKLRKWWKGTGKKTGFPRDWSAIISDTLGPMPDVERDDVEESSLIPYSGRDADATARDFPYLWERCQALNLEPVYRMDMAVVPMLDRMRATGMPLDLKALWALEQELTAVNTKTTTALREICGPDFNPASGDHVSKFLFGRLGVAPKKMTKSGKRPATDDKVMEAIVVELLKACGGDPKTLTGRDAIIHQFVTTEQDYREQTKMLSTFIGPLWGFYDAGSGAVHPNWRSTRVVSGRLATFDPNLLAFPIRSKWGKRVRGCFRVRPVWHNGRWVKVIFKSFDLDQIEMRGMASEACDVALIDAFLSGQDVHWANAALIFNIPYERIIDPLLYPDGKDRYRDPCKNIGFGVLYGITYIGLQAQLFLKGLDYTAQECQDLIDGWYRSHPEARRYLAEAAAETRRNGYVRDRWGRIRHLPGVWSDLQWIRAEAERQAGNFKIQAWAQGVIKRAMARIWERVLPELWAAGFYIEPLLQVHDELVFAMEEEAEELATMMILNEMKADSELFLIPVTSKGKAGMDWGSLK